ncbi:hypothetical protein [Helicobacter sp. 23-1045]
MITWIKSLILGAKCKCCLKIGGGEKFCKKSLIIVNICHKDDFAKNRVERKIHNICDGLCVVEFLCNDTTINGKRPHLGNTLAWHKIICQMTIN